MLTPIQSNLPITSATVPTLVDAFIASQDVADSSKATYRRNIKQFFIFLDLRSITQPTEEHILQYKGYLLDKKLSALSVNNLLGTVSRFFEHLHRKGLYINIADQVKLLRRSKDFYKDALSIDQVKDIFTAVNCSKVKGKRDFALINLQVRTGMRTIEIVRANNEDIYKIADDTVLRVQGKGRNEKNDIVVLTHNTIKPILAYQATKKLIDPKAPLFSSLATNAKIPRLTTRSISRIVRRYLIRAGIHSSRITPHSLRHTAITLALKAGATIQEAQALARHHSINTTMIYAHNLDRIANAAEYKIDALLGDSDVYLVADTSEIKPTEQEESDETNTD